MHTNKPLLRVVATLTSILLVMTSIPTIARSSGGRLAVLTPGGRASAAIRAKLGGALAERATRAGYEVVTPSSVEAKAGGGGDEVIAACGDDPHCIAEALQKTEAELALIVIVDGPDTDVTVRAQLFDLNGIRLAGQTSAKGSSIDPEGLALASLVGLEMVAPVPEARPKGASIAVSPASEESEQWYEKWWVWAIAGLAVAGGAGAALAGGGGGGEGGPGNTGITVGW